MNISFIPVKSPSDQELLAKYAGIIWREYWPQLIGSEQTEYMIEQFQSLEAIKRDMSQNHYEYWLLVSDDDSKQSIVGFTGGHNEPESERFFISKIYLLSEARGHGFARRVIEFYRDLCFVRNFKAAYLTVNKENELGIRAYKGTGFKVIDATVTDIGSGFVMDDYIMQIDFAS